MVTYIEKNDGSFITELPVYKYPKKIQELVDSGSGVYWEGNLLVSTTPDIKIMYNEKRIWKEKIKGVGRNHKCVCGSGKKFKKCCLKKELV
tara:strand:- start:117 stop:389 length:273 start_codon:yes stop_codon:yes gene_type:complete